MCTAGFVRFNMASQHADLAGQEMRSTRRSKRLNPMDSEGTYTKNSPSKSSHPLFQTQDGARGKIGESVPVANEYEWDSSDEEDIRNAVGNIPMEWYKEYPHLGYDWHGKRIVKPATPDEIEKFMQRIDAGGIRPVIFDEKTGREIPLTPEDIDVIRRLRVGAYPDALVDPFLPSLESDEIALHPINDRMPTKRSFLPSRGDKEKISRLVHALKMGWTKPTPFVEPRGEDEDTDDEPPLYDLWSDADEKQKLSQSARSRKHHYIPAPKMKLPGHQESYNPPEEYLMTKEEREIWKKRDREDRELKYQPKKYSSMRVIPAWRPLTRERFERCLDLYLAPRQLKMRVQVNPDELLPQLPKPKDLQPFPTMNAIIYRGHKSHVRAITVQPAGQFMASGADDATVKVWEISTGRCMNTIQVGSPITITGDEISSVSTSVAGQESTYTAADNRVMCLTWCPDTTISLLAVGVGKQLILANAAAGDRLVVSNTERVLARRATVSTEDAKAENSDAAEAATEENAEKEADTEESKEQSVIWRRISPLPTESSKPAVEASSLALSPAKGHQRIVLENLGGTCVDCAWHPRGDYFATVVSDASTSATTVVVHQLSKQRSHVPFSRKIGLIQRIVFHPKRPILFVATQTSVYVYELLKRELQKKLLPNCKWISSISIHSSGDHLLVGSYDTKIAWIDMDLGVKPHQVLRYHSKAVRSVAYHAKYPLFATCSDDGTVVVCHGMVYSDISKNPLIVPLKVLRGHTVSASGLGALACVWHPQQPWVFSAGADHSVRLYS